MEQVDTCFSNTLACNLFGFFFFQAEDGIRDDLVTGVQTCALPISGLPAAPFWNYLQRGQPARQMATRMCARSFRKCPLNETRALIEKIASPRSPRPRRLRTAQTRTWP